MWLSHRLDTKGGGCSRFPPFSTGGDGYPAGPRISPGASGDHPGLKRSSSPFGHPLTLFAWLPTILDVMFKRRRPMWRL
jgi:hypothetical protein